MSDDKWYSGSLSFVFFVRPTFNTESISWPTHTARVAFTCNLSITISLWGFSGSFFSSSALEHNSGDLIRWSSTMRIISFLISLPTTPKHRPTLISQLSSKCYRKVDLILIRSQNCFGHVFYSCCVVSLRLSDFHKIVSWTSPTTRIANKWMWLRWDCFGNVVGSASCFTFHQTNGTDSCPGKDKVWLTIATLLADTSSAHLAAVVG